MPLPAFAVQAQMALALLWGWPRVAALLGVGRVGLLPLGELLGARRAKLVLSHDLCGQATYALWVVRGPQTRLTAGRSQSARIEPAGMVAMLDAAVGHMQRAQRLWPGSGALCCAL